MEIMNQVLAFASTLAVIVIAVVQLVKKTVNIPQMITVNVNYV